MNTSPTLGPLPLAILGHSLVATVKPTADISNRRATNLQLNLVEPRDSGKLRRKSATRKLHRSSDKQPFRRKFQKNQLLAQHHPEGQTNNQYRCRQRAAGLAFLKSTLRACFATAAAQGKARDVLQRRPGGDRIAVSPINTQESTVLVKSIDLDIDAALRDRVRRQFYDEGASIVEWARANSFSPDLVYAVLSGRSPAQRGASHRIAVALGLKPELPSVFSPRPAEISAGQQRDPSDRQKSVTTMEGPYMQT